MSEELKWNRRADEALRAENARLREALAPFADIKADDGDDFSRYDDQVVIRCEVTAGEIRRARVALASEPPATAPGEKETPE